MRREELWRAVQKVREVILKLKLRDAIESTISRTEKKDDAAASDALRAFKEWSLFVATSGPPERELIHILKLDPLDNETFWFELISKGREAASPSLFNLIQTLHFIAEKFHDVVTLIQPEAIRKLEAKPDILKNQLLTVIVLEEPDKFSTPLRLSQVLSSITLLYEACATLENISENTLSVVACDSGSDKSFDFFGVAKAIADVKEIILGLCDRILFYREHRAKVRIDLIAQSLPIFDRLSELEKGQKIEPERAERFKKLAQTELLNFLRLGRLFRNFKKEQHQSIRAN